MNQPSFGTRLFRALKNLALTLLVVGLAGAAVYALSMLNVRTFTLEVRAGQLIVLKGRMLPWGADPWTPADPLLADAYAPLDLEGNTALAVVGPRYEDRDELDRALFQVLEMLARPRLASDAPKDIERGLYLVRRAERLPGLTETQRGQLKKMQSDVAFYLARTRLDDARRQLEEALTQLKLAAESDTRHRPQATLMLLAVEPQVKLLSTTLRTTTMTSDVAGGLLKAVEPQLQGLFETLQDRLKAMPSAATDKPTAAEPTPAPATE
jgi:hypothetical protein